MSGTGKNNWFSRLDPVDGWLEPLLLTAIDYGGKGQEAVRPKLISTRTCSSRLIRCTSRHSLNNNGPGWVKNSTELQFDGNMSGISMSCRTQLLAFLRHYPSAIRSSSLMTFLNS
jgi:hypothetical protein